MKLVEVGSVLPNDLSAPDFPFLIPNADRYSVALLQPVGKIVTKSDGVRHADTELARAKFLSYLKLAAARNADIAVTPEYSCPWPVVREAIHSKVLPHEAGLWILGCEAITPGQLQAFKEEMKGTAEVLFEDLTKLGGAKEKGFIDPLCYLFHAKTLDGTKRLVVLVQMKTKPMGGHPYELNNLSSGNDVYVFRNSGEHTIKLLSLICSDVLGWDGATCDEIRGLFVNPSRLLLFHLQLNKQSRHPLYRRYRATFLSSQMPREVICLNWARKVVEYEPEKNTTNNWDNDSVSALYARAWGRGLMDEPGLDQQEHKGMYFSYCDELRAFLGILNFSEHSFVFKLSKVNQDLAPEAHRIYRPPEVEAVLEWANGAWQAAKLPLEADYKAQMAAVGIDISKIAMLPANPLRFERLAALSVGALGDVVEPSAQWPKFVSVDANNMDGSETIRRTSFGQDTSEAARNFRMHRYSDFYRLMQLVAAGTYFRPTMKAFIGGTLDFDPANPFCNLASNDGRRGVAIFLADSSMLAAENTYTRVVNQSVASYAMKGIGNGVPLPDDIVIWQLPNAGGPPRTYPAYKPPTVNDNPKERPAQVNSDTK